MTSTPNHRAHVLRRNVDSPQNVDIESVPNITELLVRRAGEAPDHVAFERRRSGAGGQVAWDQVTTRQFLEEVTALAKGMIAVGVEPGDTVVIMAPTQYLWAVADQAALFAGAVVVPVYDTAPVQQLKAIFTDAQPALVLAATAAHRERVVAAIGSATGEPAHPALPSVWVMDPETSHSFQDLAAKGTAVSDAQLHERRLRAHLDDLATIVYTSGTTGTPKGAMITHRNMVGQVTNTAAAYTEVVKESGNTVLFLPLTHVLGRALQLICIANGMRIAHLSEPKEIVSSLPMLRPTFLVVVPRLLERIVEASTAAARQKRLLPLWQAAQRTAVAWAEYLEQRDRNDSLRAPLGLRVRRAVFDRLFYRRLRAAMGGHIEYLLSGAATLRPELARFFRGIGIPVIEGYGLTETTAPLTAGRPGSLVAGTVGPPLPGNAVRIAENGEVLARGVGVFAGYRDPTHNEGAFVDGYFRTGDLGWLSAEGSLTLVGRLKHVIVTSTGRTVSPEAWEQAVETHPLIAHAVLVGTDRPYLTALLVIDAEAVIEWFRQRGDAAPTVLSQPGISVCRDGRLTQELSDAVVRANDTVPPAEQVRLWSAIHVADTQLSELLTPTMKLKRQALLQLATDTIEELYRSQDHQN